MFKNISFRSITGSSLGAGALLICLVLGFSEDLSAEVQPDSMTVEKLPAKQSPHWVWVGDMNFAGVLDGRVILIDTDSAKVLGMLSTGIFTNRVVLPSHKREIYVLETYFSRGSRGTRTDVISVYDPRTLGFLREVVMPPKRATGMPHWAYDGISDDGKLFYAYNSTPAQSVSVANMDSYEFTEEIETAGCALVYPSGNRFIRMLCADGAMLSIELDASGKLKGKERSAPFFDVKKDPVTEKAVRWGDTWLFASFDGYLYPVDASKPKPNFLARWSLVSEEEREKSWRVGGSQLMAVHQGLGRLYVLMHQGGRDTVKDPGDQVWVYDLEKKKRIQKIHLQNIASSIRVTRDDAPVLISAFLMSSDLDIYDARTGELLRTLEGVAGVSPILLNTP